MEKTIPLMGLETEYGIVREDVENSDPVEESMRLLRRCEARSVFGCWDYSRERTHLDQRGFTVNRLAQDEEEDEFCAEDGKRPYTYWEMKSDRVLSNGARFYNDHTHPEYCTPECLDVFQLAAHDLAGDRIVAECARLRNQDLGRKAVQIFKNNTDYSGHSYGTHDNYMIPRRLPFDQWVKELVPFLVTRQLYAGAGKVGSEWRKGEPFSGLQLSQRADFIETVLSIETMTQRPLVNTRDEPHASPAEYRRLHLILGDANMSPYATALKVGTTQLVLTLIAEEKAPLPHVLADPVADVKRVSRDRTGRVLLKRESGQTIAPVEVQERYLLQAKRHYEGQCEEWDWVIREWERVLEELKTAPEKLSDRIDWAIKEKLFLQFMETEGVDWDDPWMQSLDLEYHNLDPERGLYYGLEQEGAVQPFLVNGEPEEARVRPPQGTRAMIRGQAVERQNDEIRSIHWTGIEFKNGDCRDLTFIVTPTQVEQALNQKKESIAWT
ncbi:MAG: proteasome accessory factor PafA2 family protein [Nitrospinae bacterium]|nr:proteasome accessory factor PafA2 family protein [Nitrospinota bacterium]